MTTNNSEIEAERLDVGHELPAGQDGAGEIQDAEQQGITAAEAPPAGADLERAEAERKALQDRLARLQAEFENSRKRAAREQLEFKEFAVAEALKSLLPILDSLDRALQAPAQTLEEFRSGIQLIRKQFEDALAKLGLDQVPTKGETFDPRVHEAVEVVETASAADNQVLEELQRGYKLRDRLLRPAMVRVARNPKHGTEPEAAA
ncbi:MAG: nucleotide exchange factor GrpE [Candidatus Sulfotelmatobacter sp.]|jgi:molecular chaperone GrpE